MQLVSDVGGTNARLALAEDGALIEGSLRRYRGDDHASYDSVLTTFLAESGHPRIDAVCVAVAGPVAGGHASLTNRDWDFEAARLAMLTGAPTVRLINDLTALGHATGRLERTVLREGTPMPSNGQSLVVNAGTGFNVCAVATAPDGARICLEAEEGHTELPATLATRLRARIGDKADRFPTVEETFAGRGLAGLHAALTGAQGMRGEAVVAAAEAGDAAAGATLDLYADLFGLVLRELALRFMPRDGLWLAGSVARAAVPRLPRITAAMAEREQLRDIASGVPLLLIEDDMAGLLGCLAAISPRR